MNFIKIKTILTVLSSARSILAIRLSLIEKGTIGGSIARSGEKMKFCPKKRNRNRLLPFPLKTLA
jgi:hypothetical protein